MLINHGITSARYAVPAPQGGYPLGAEVIVMREDGREQKRLANDDIDGGGMLAFLATGGSIQPYLPPTIDLLVYAVEKRKEREQIGLTVAPGVSIATDDRSKLMLMGARVAAESNPTFETPWEDADGNTVMLTAAQIIGVSNAVLAHVAGCFAIFAQVKAGIASETITTTEEIDAAFAA